MSEADSQFDGAALSSLCSVLATPAMLTGVFRDILTRHFQPGFIEQNELREAIWRPGNDTSIVIESIHRWRPQTTGVRPAVIVKRNAYRNQRVGIGDRRQGNPTDRSGNQSFSTFWVGSHTLFCLGQEGAQAELLATETQRELTEFGPVLQKSLRLTRFSVLEVGPVSLLEEAAENYVVPVTVGYACEQSWRLLQQAPPPLRLALTTLLEC